MLDEYNITLTTSANYVILVFGPPMGESICLDYYFTCPDTVSSLVLVGSVGIQKHRERFSDLDVPCLLVWEGNDSLSPLADAHFLKQKIPVAELVVLENASHTYYLDNPEKWHQSLVTFLNKNIL